MTDAHEHDNKFTDATNHAAVWTSRITDAVDGSRLGAPMELAMTLGGEGITAQPLKGAAKAVRQAGKALSESNPVVIAGSQVVNGNPTVDYAIRMPGTGNVLGRIGSASQHVGRAAYVIGFAHAWYRQWQADAAKGDADGAHRFGRATVRAGVETTIGVVGGKAGVLLTVALLAAAVPAAGPVTLFTALIAGGWAGGNRGAKAGRWIADRLLN